MERISSSGSSKTAKMEGGKLIFYRENYRRSSY